MRDMNIYQGGELLPADARRTSRALSRQQTQGLLRQAAIDVETDVTLDKVAATTTATGAGMASVLQVAQAQMTMEQLAPQASARLNLLADRQTLAVADEVDRLHQRLRQL